MAAGQHNPGSSAGWLTMLEIIKEGHASVGSDPLIACPNDGEPLELAADGRLFCPYDGWRPGAD